VPATNVQRPTLDVSNQSFARAPGLSFNESSNGDCPGLIYKAFAAPQAAVPGYHLFYVGGDCHEHPHSAARHREALVPSRAKSDASDAYYLMDLVRH